MYKVVQINVTANWGSTGRIADEIGQTIIANGGDSYIAYSRKCNASSSNLIRIGNELDVYWHALQTRFFDKNGLASKMATRRLIEQLESLNPNIIHLHNIHGYYLNYPLLFTYLMRKQTPIVWTLHDCWAFTGHCAYFSYAHCERWKKACYDCPQLDKYPVSWFADRSRRNFMDKKKCFSFMKDVTLVPVSNWLSNLLEDSFLKNYPKEVIHNGINIDAFNIQNISANVRNEMCIGEHFVILGVANIWEERKGLNDFLELRKSLSKDCLIILIGLTPKQIRKLPEGIIGISRTDSTKELADYYSVADVYLNPTWEDNFPTTNLEALACGTPVITYRTGGSIEAIDNDTGFIIEQGNIKEIVKAIETVRKNGKSFYSKACRHRVVNLYDKNQCYKKYIQLYEKILDNNNYDF